MIFLNPKDFEGCESRKRIIISSTISYRAGGQFSDIVFQFMNTGHFVEWGFDNYENRENALKEIDRICKNKHNQVDDLLYTIETQ